MRAAPRTAFSDHAAVGRRVILHSAWTVPAVVVAGAAPAVAASSVPVTVVVDSICLTSNNNRLRIRLRVSNPTTDTGRLNVTGAVVNNANLNTNDPGTTLMANGMTFVVIETANPNLTAGQNVAVSVDYSVALGSRPRVSGTVNGNAVVQSQCFF